MKPEDVSFYGGFIIITLAIGFINMMLGNGNGSIACAIVFAATLWAYSKEKTP